MQIHRNIPQLCIDDEFKGICRQIIQEKKTLEEWFAIESDDMFQTAHYCGGFEGTEEEFCFSYIDGQGKEWWFQCSVDEVERIVDGRLQYLDMREAEE
jgi:hypothetical protein